MSHKDEASLLHLPPEILNNIFARVSRESLKSLALTCAQIYPHASALIWHTIDITDKCSARRLPDKDAYKIDVDPEHDADSYLYPGMPLRWGPAALQTGVGGNLRGASALDYIDGEPAHNMTSVRRNLLDSDDIADEDRCERDLRYSQTDKCDNGLGLDQHDDIPAIRKLYLLATRPDLAARVHVLCHRCHLPTPDMSTELVWMCTGGQTLSSDWRVLVLLRLAIQNMVNVTTLRLVMPHWNFYWVMICDFMDSNRNKSRPVTRLWLETCTAVWDAGQWPSRCDFSTLKSIRLRRLKIENHRHDPTHQTMFPPYFLARTGPPVRLRNGYGGQYFASTHDIAQEHICRPYLDENSPKVPPTDIVATSCRGAQIFDQTVSSQSPDLEALLDMRQHEIGRLMPLIDASHATGDCSREYHKGRRMVRWLARNCCNLTHLNIDWLILRRPDITPALTLSTMAATTSDRFLFADLSKLRIETLRSFQLRNAIALNSILPPDVFLLTPTNFTDDSTGSNVHRIDFLGFLEAHPKLTCLAWPMDAIVREPLLDLPHSKAKERVESAQLAKRMQVVLNRLGSHLDTLRLDVRYQHKGEPHSQLPTTDFHEIQSCKRRRLFIETMACRMTSIRTLKLEGYIPRDEKREILQAMAACPLERFISIGRTFPLGNTWGVGAADLERWEQSAWDHISVLTFNDHLQAEIPGSIQQDPRTRSLVITKNYSREIHFPHGMPPAFPGGNFNDMFTSPGGNVNDMFTSPGGNFNDMFTARYGWTNAEPPLLSTISLNFADTITELKFCGFNGSIVYGHKFYTSGDSSLNQHARFVNDMVLYYLRDFHNLQNLVLSYYLPRDTRFEEEDVILTWLCERDALWHGKQEGFENELPNAETDDIIWDDLYSNEVGKVDIEDLLQVIETFRDFKLVQHALRRAFIYDKNWIIQSSISPFPRFPSFEPYRDSMNVDIDYVEEQIPYGVENQDDDRNSDWSGGGYPDFESAHAQEAAPTDPNDTGYRLSIFNILPFPYEQIYPQPEIVFAPFRYSRFISQWLNSAFLAPPTEPTEVEFFWRHVASSLQILRHRFAPGRMAQQISEEIGGYLSGQALEKGVNVRASFCLGTESCDVFDLDIKMNAGGVQRFWGPRPDSDPDRRREKNDARQYF